MNQPTRRAIVTTLVAILGATVGVAGVGHLYLRRWRRAAAWFLLVVGTTVTLLAVFVFPGASGLTNPAAITAIDPSSLPGVVVWPVFALLLLSTLDANRLAMVDPRAGDAPTCPSCGKAADPDLEFCPWCTVELEWVDPDADTDRQ